MGDYCPFFLVCFLLASIAPADFGRTGYITAQIGLNGALQSLNIVSVIQSAQVMDQTLAAIFGKSCGINISPFKTYTDDDHVIEGSTSVWTCIDESQYALARPLLSNPDAVVVAIALLPQVAVVSTDAARCCIGTALTFRMIGGCNPHDWWLQSPCPTCECASFLLSFLLLPPLPPRGQAYRERS